jgi:dolichyl-phosphate beta-glucosyltransferase
MLWRIAEKYGLNNYKVGRIAINRFKQPEVSVVIPAYNEEARITPTLKNVVSYLRENTGSSEVIVIDDGSTDATRRAVFAVQKEYSPFPIWMNPRRNNLGKGASVNQGAMLSSGKFMLFDDADGSTPIEELGKLMPFLTDQEFDIAIGSRGLAASYIVEHQPFYREFMGKTFNFFVRHIAVPGIQDTQCGFKLFSRSAVDRIFPLQMVERFSFDVELLYLARKFDLKIAEVPITWLNSPRSTVNPLSDAAKMFLDLLRIRMSHVKD